MRALAALIADLAREELDALRGDLAREAVLRLLVALFVVLAAGFAVVLGVVALADWLGLKAALAISAGVALLIALIFWAALAAGRRRSRRAAAARRAAEVRALRLALLEATLLLRNAPLLAFVAALMAGLNMGRSGGSKDGDGEKDGDGDTPDP